MHGCRHHQPLIAPGEFNENVGKRSESSNRKYRAFKNFLKQQSSSNPVASGATAFGGSASAGPSSYQKGPGASMTLFSSNTIKTVLKGMAGGSAT
jgi:hypothetical protein